MYVGVCTYVSTYKLKVDMSALRTGHYLHLDTANQSGQEATNKASVIIAVSARFKPGLNQFGVTCSAWTPRTGPPATGDGSGDRGRGGGG